MSVRGFNTGAGVERYDYNALDNIPATTNTRVKGDAETEYRQGNVNLTKANIGLGNVDNTSDANKPVSTAQQTALNGKVDKVAGKGLSTNDYTDADKQKVDDAASQADLDDLSRQLSEIITSPPISALYGKYMLPANGRIGNSSNWASMRESDVFYVVKGTKVTIDNSQLGDYYVSGAMYSASPAGESNFITGTSQSPTKQKNEYVAPCDGYFWFGVSTNPATTISAEIRMAIFDALSFEIVTSKIEKLERTTNEIAADVEDLKKGDLSSSVEPTIAGSGYINGTSGQIITSHNTMSRTEFLDVSFAKTITFPQYFSGGVAGYYFYDKNQAAISGSGGVLIGNVGDEITVNVPDSGYYFAATVLNSNINDMFINAVFNTKEYIDKIVDDENSPVDSPNVNELFSIFKHIGVIGDSLSSGMFNAPANGTTPATTLTRYEYSWIQQIAQRLNLTAYNFASPGLSTRSWLTSEYPAMLQDGAHDCEAYFIALCHNAYNQELPIGTAADVGTEADTFYGNYSRIIELVQTYAPYSKVFIITAKDETKFAQYNEAIRYMATVYIKNVYVLDMGLYGGGADVPAWMKTGSHGNAMGYLIYSRWIEAITNWYIYNNSGQFKYVQLIGTSAEQNIPDEQKA